MDQGNLFPATTQTTRLVSVDPDDLGSTDGARIGQGEDGCAYVFKTGSAHEAIPHSEWFCTKLGELLGIPAPYCTVILLPDGSTAFGSRWISPIIRPEEAIPWWECVSSSEDDLKKLQSLLSKIYAYDHFIHNQDRHLGNFLIIAQPGGFGLLAFDYSQAWVTFGFPLADLPLPECKTIKAQRMLTELWGKQYVDGTLVRDLCEKLRTISRETVSQIIFSHPPHWIADDLKVGILEWWGSDSMAERLDGIVQGINNGDHL